MSMTESEIKNTKEWFEDFSKTYELSTRETEEFQNAVACLGEIQQYRVIGTVEECEKAMDFELAKKDKSLAKVIDEYLEYIKIGTIEEFNALKQWKSDIIETFGKYNVSSIDELMKRFKELAENNNRIIEILRTHRFTDEECIEKITEIVGIHSQN